MKSFVLGIIVVLVCLGSGAQAAEQGKSIDLPNKRTFELTPMAPPIPARKYQLTFDDTGDRISGNAAILYLDSVLLLDAGTREKIRTATEVYGTDKAAFGSIADSIEATSVLQEIELAGRRADCNWDSPFREMGAQTLLPHLEPLYHGVGRLLWVRAHRQIEQGKIDEAIKTIRLGYEMSEKIGREGTLVSALVAKVVSEMMDDCVVELTSRADSPNLFWALSMLPARQKMLRHSLDVESQWALLLTPELASMQSEGNLTADQWRRVFAKMQRLADLDSPNGHARLIDVVKDASDETLEKARSEYANVHHLTAKQAAAAEAICVLGEYYFRQYQVAYDEWSKCRGLAYPALIEKAGDYDRRWSEMQREQPPNPLARALPLVTGPVRAFARSDRQLAALTVVEALRAYAAANGDKLPERLDEIVETPVPMNPMTGKPFEYAVTNGVATISDTASFDRLEYTVKIRK